LLCSSVYDVLDGQPAKVNAIYRMKQSRSPVSFIQINSSHFHIASDEPKHYILILNEILTNYMVTILIFGSAPQLRYIKNIQHSILLFNPFHAVLFSPKITEAHDTPEYQTFVFVLLGKN
jgi:hypothetical protein